MKSHNYSLVLILLAFLGTFNLHAQKIPYGNNPETGKYFQSDGAKLYFEVYGSGDPLLLLHGGVYGYIDEFEGLIPELAKNYQVICLATRGHGKSEVGDEAYTYLQRATDAQNLLDHLGIEKAVVVGFSDGGFSALKLAAQYPKRVTKVVAMGVGDLPADRKKEANYSEKSLMAQSGAYFQGRKKIMPEPERWGKSLEMLNHLYNEDILSQESLGKIQAPALLINGEKDDYYTPESFETCFGYIPNAQKVLVPGCGHVILYCNFPLVLESIQAFLL